MSVIAPLSLHSLSTMSKDNMLLGYARGKVGSLVFARRAGQQITRAYNANPANPRSTGQMSQRMLMSTAIQAYKFMSSICDHSFEDAVGKNGNMRAFMSAALRDLKATPSAFGFQKYGERKLIPGPFQISAGSLSSILAPAVETTVDSAKLVLRTFGAAGINMDYVCRALGLHNVGDMVTYPIVYPNVLTGSGFSFVRLTLVSAPTGQVEVGNIPSTLIKVEAPSSAAVAANVAYEARQDSGYAATISINALPAWLPATGAVYFSTAAIRSRMEDGKWLRSEAYLNMGTGFVPAPTYAEALATYPQNTAPVLDGGQV